MLNELGKMVCEEWKKTTKIRQEIEIDEFITMPNHFHGIIFINDKYKGDRPVAPTKPGPRPKSIGAMIAGFKCAITKRINIIRRTPGVPIWQRNYWEHVIRNEEDLNRIREYIINNPLQWDIDKENPKHFV